MRFVKINSMIEAMAWCAENPNVSVWNAEIVRPGQWCCSIGEDIPPVYRDTPWGAILAAKKASEQ